MKRALLNVVGTQTADGESDKIELTTVGSIDKDSENYYIYYDEEEEGASTVHVKITVGKKLDVVTTERSGCYSSTLVIEKGKRNQCHYATPYGEILMGIRGKSVTAILDKNKGTFDFIYTIDVNGSVASTNEVKIKFRVTEN